MIEIGLDKTRKSFPENWNECSKNQLFHIVHFLFMKERRLQSSEWSYFLILRLLGVKLWRVKFVWKFLRLPKNMVVQVFFPLLDFIRKENTLSQFKLKSFKVGFNKYYAPKDGLINITIGEFSFADPLYINYKKTGNEDFLDGLVAILYRKKRSDYNPGAANFKGDLREEFNEHLIVRNAIKIKKLAHVKKHLIFLAYEGSRNEIVKNCQSLFKDKEEIKQGKNFGYGGLILELAGNKFGNNEQTAKTNLITIFNFLEMEASKSLKQQQ